MSTETITLDASDDATAAGRVSLNITPWIKGEGVDYGDAAIIAYMAEAARGDLPVDFRVPNRTITIPFNLQTIGGTSYTTIRQQLQAKAALFQREGGWLKRDIDGTPWYADVVSATLHLGADALTVARDLDTNAVLTLECVPDFYGDEITLDDTSETTLPELVRVLKLATATASIDGDYGARVRIVVDNDSTGVQFGLIWGLRSRHYDSATTAKLAYEAEALTTLSSVTFGSSAVGTVTGASGGGTNNVMQHTTLSTDWTPVVSTTISGTGDMTHKGTYRVWVRAYSTSGTPPRVRLAWNVGQLLNPTENTPQRIATASQFQLLDLGEVRLDPQPVGTHYWQGQIWAAGDAGGENVSIDKVWLVPVDDGYGVLRASTATTPQIATSDAVAFASKPVVLSTQGMSRENSNGVGYGPVGDVRGDLPRLPPSGLEARPVELFLKMSRSDLDTGADTAIDDISAQSFYRPSFLTVPTS